MATVAHALDVVYKAMLLEKKGWVGRREEGERKKERKPCLVRKPHVRWAVFPVGAALLAELVEKDQTIDWPPA